jgi:geranylgeranyl diphosphate synthase type I
VTGKPGGDDLLARKPTVLWMAASERLDPAGLRVLDRVGTPGAAPDDVATLQQAMLRAGIGAWAEDRVRSLVERATQGVDSGVLTPSGVEGLRRAAESVAWRDA